MAMALTAVIERLEDVAEDMRSLYTEKEGVGYILDIANVKDHPDAMGAFAALGVERTKNKSLKAELEKFKDVDLDDYKIRSELDLDEIDSLRQRQAAQEENGNNGKKQSGSEIEAEVSKRVESMVRKYTSEIDARDSSIKDLNAKLSESVKLMTTFQLNQEVDAASVKVGVKPSAMTDVRDRAAKIFRMEEGTLTPFGTDGEVIRGADAVHAQTVEEFIVSLQPTAEHLFQGSSGSGGSGSGEKPKAGRVRSKKDLQTVDQQAAYIHEFGGDAYHKLPVE